MVIGMKTESLQKAHDKERKALEKMLCTMCQTSRRLHGSRWCWYCTNEAKKEFEGFINTEAKS